MIPRQQKDDRKTKTEQANFKNTALLLGPSAMPRSFALLLHPKDTMSRGKQFLECYQSLVYMCSLCIRDDMPARCAMLFVNAAISHHRSLIECPSTISSSLPGPPSRYVVGRSHHTPNGLLPSQAITSIILCFAIKLFCLSSRETCQ